VRIILLLDKESGISMITRALSICKAGETIIYLLLELISLSIHGSNWAISREKEKRSTRVGVAHEVLDNEEIYSLSARVYDPRPRIFDIRERV